MWKNWGRDHIRDVPKVTQSPNPTWLVFKVEYVYSMVIKRIQREKGKILNAHNILCVCVCTFYFVHSIFAGTCTQNFSGHYALSKSFVDYSLKIMTYTWARLSLITLLTPLQSRHLWYWAHTTLPINWTHSLSLSWGLGIKTISARLFKLLFLYLLASKLHHSFLKHTDLKEGRNPTFKVTLLLQLWIVKGNKNF